MHAIVIPVVILEGRSPDRITGIFVGVKLRRLRVNDAQGVVRRDFGNKLPLVPVLEGKRLLDFKNLRQVIHFHFANGHRQTFRKPAGYDLSFSK